MIIIRRLHQIPARSVLSDLALKNGSANEEDTLESTPYDGLGVQTYDWSANTTESLKEMFASVDEYNPHKQKPVEGEYMKRENLDSVYDYYTHLEDISASWVVKYFENMKYHIVNSDSGLETVSRNNNKDEIVLVDEETDTAAETGDVSLFDVHDTLEASYKLLYYVKRLTLLGDKRGVHMMSLIIAYEKAKNKRSSATNRATLVKNDGKPKQQEILQYPIFASNRYGGYLKNNAGEPVLIDENKGIFANWAYSFIENRDIASNEIQYYKDYTNLLSLCRKLDISIIDDDPRLYTEEFIADISVKYIESKKSASMYKGDNVVSGIDINDVFVSSRDNTSNISVGGSSVEEYVSKKIESLPYDTKFTRGCNLQLAYIVYKLFTQIDTNVQLKDMDDITVVDDFLADRSGNILRFKAAPIQESKVAVTSNDEFAIHSSGSLVMLSRNPNLIYLTSDMALNMMHVFLSTIDDIDSIDRTTAIYRYPIVVKNIKGYQFGRNNTKYGVWLQIRI